MLDLEKLPKSPITGKSGTKVIETFSAKDIIELYQLQENINVEKYFANPIIYLLECEETKYRFYYPFEIAGDKEFYQNLRNSEYDRENAEDHQFAVKHIKANDRVLEVGCGSGKFLESVSNITTDCYGLELNSLIAEKARTKGLNVETQLIEEHAKENSNSYDVVCAFQVLEHIPNVNSFILAALELLKPNGKLIFSVPNNEPFFQRFSKYEVLNLPPHHMGLWNLESFKNLCKFFNLDLENFALAGKSSLKADLYLRAKLMANVKSVPNSHTITEKACIILFAPFAAILSFADYIKSKNGYGHISVILKKK
jgi:2-polyprenyl-3-methyl-5-hydroxy-6-metoxy-1,4-benzoquinol methylase